MASKEQMQYVSSVCEMFEEERFRPHLEDLSSPTQNLIVLHIGDLANRDQADLIKVCQKLEEQYRKTPERDRVATQVRYVGGK